MLVRFITSICLIVLHAMVSGCGYDGPFYTVEQLLVDDSGMHAVLSRSHTKGNWLRYGDTEPRRSEYVIAPVDLSDSPKLSDGRSIGEAGWNETKRFRRLTDSMLLVEFNRGQREVRIDIEKSRQRTRPVLPPARDPEKTVTALSRSCRHLLIVDDLGERLLDLPSGNVLESRKTSDLTALRRELVPRFGSAGTWWLSDDLKFVTIKPAEWITEPGVTRTPEAMPAKLFGIDLRLDRDGLIYERATGRFQPFPLSIVPAKPRDYSVEVGDAESVDGQLLLLYGARGLGQDKEIVLVAQNLERGVRGNIQFESDSFPADVAWRPSESRIYFLEYPDHGGIASSPQRNGAAFRIHRLDYSTSEAQHYAIPDANLIEVVERALR